MHEGLKIEMLAPEQKLDIVAQLVQNCMFEYVSIVSGMPARKWEDLPQDTKDTLILAVGNVVDSGETNPEKAHEKWVDHMKSKGWKPSDHFDANRKLHPDLVGWNELPPREQLKDYLFLSIAHTVGRFLLELDRATVPAIGINKDAEDIFTKQVDKLQKLTKQVETYRQEIEKRDEEIKQLKETHDDVESDDPELPPVGRRSTVAFLQNIAKERDLPENEWKDLKKEELIDYINTQAGHITK